MRFTTTAATLAGALALMAPPALAMANHVPGNPGTAHIPANQGTQRALQNPGQPADPGAQSPGMPADPGSQSTGALDQGTGPTPVTPGPNASQKAKARAYGTYCAKHSKKHVEGEKGTEFSRCVTAMAKLNSDESRSARQACKTESKEHVDGEKGTPFSRCVRAGAKLLRNRAAEDQPTS